MYFHETKTKEQKAETQQFLKKYLKEKFEIMTINENL